MVPGKDPGTEKGKGWMPQTWTHTGPSCLVALRPGGPSQGGGEMKSHRQQLGLEQMHPKGIEDP